MNNAHDATVRERPSFTLTCGPGSLTIVTAPPSFQPSHDSREHTMAMPMRPSYVSHPPVSSRPSSPTFAIGRDGKNVRSTSVHDEVAVRLTWLAYAVALSALGVVLGLAIGLFLAPATPFAAVI